VRRSCITEINNLKACDNQEGQTWIFIVGDSGMYNSFDNFQDIVNTSVFQEEWYLDTVNNQWVYYASIDIDSINIEYAWNRDSSSSSGIFSATAADVGLSIYPNPAAGLVTVDLSAFANQAATLKVINSLGEKVFCQIKSAFGSSVFSINTSLWAEGIYLFTVEVNNKRLTKKIIKGN